MKTRAESIAVIVRFCIGMAALCTVGVGLHFFLSHRNAVVVSVRTAEIEFSRLRARFSDQQPLLDMNLRKAQEVSTSSSNRARLHSFHTVIFDTRGQQRMVSITVPFWLARRFANRDGEFRWLGELTFLDDTEFDSEAIRLSLDQIERRGPGLVADHRHPSGGQFLSWVE